MDVYFIVKTLHILSSAILFGSGLGIAFFMFCSYFSSDLIEKRYAAKLTVLADKLFTLPAVIFQPLSGAWLVWRAGYDWSALWLVLTYLLYAVAALCWLPVVWIQIQIKKMLIACHSVEGSALPPRYAQLLKIWFVMGWPAFLGVIAIFFLMVMKPT